LFPRFHVKLPPKIKRYFKDNPGAIFVMGFQLLLLACAGLLIQDNLVMANELAVYAYFLLVIGVVLQLVVYLRHKNEGEGKEDDG